jgi:hypothetical protein
VITFLLPSCFLTLSGFRFNPLGGRPQPHPMGAIAPFSRGWGPAAPPLGSPSESLIEGGVASTIPLKQNHIPALIVSTPGFGPGTLPLLALPARTKRRHSRAQTAVQSLALGSAGAAVFLSVGVVSGKTREESEPVMGQEPYLPL